MDLQFDESWCPVCDRQIMPKRFLVPVPPPQPPSSGPSAPPSSPSSSPSKNQQSDSTITRQTRPKNNALRTKGGGLLQGTGRVKPNGTIKRTDSSSTGKNSQPQVQQPAAKPAVPIKHRTVIDQGPIPLYCSDECRMTDLNRAAGAFHIGYNPERESPPLPPVPHNSFSGMRNDVEDDSSSATGSSVESHVSYSASPVVSRSMATLAALYDFPPLPEVPTLLSAADSGSSSDSEYSHEYQSGIMMAARRITAALCPDPAQKRKAYSHEVPQPRKPIPGWTDGSDAWRSSVYSFAAPSENSSKEGTGKAYSSFSASPHRSRGVYSTIGESSTPTGRNNSVASLPTQRHDSDPLQRSNASYTEELYAKYSLSLSRRSESRNALFPSSSAHSLPSTSGSSRRRREVSLVKPGAEGRLLVPDLKAHAHTGSSLSLSSSCDGTSTTSWRSGSSYPASSRPGVRSPLSRFPSEISEDNMQSEQRDKISASLPPPPQRPTVQTRSWSYDNVKTYPVMMPPPKKEKRIEKRVVDGEEKDIEVEIEIHQPLKRLFLFPDKDVTTERPCRILSFLYPGCTLPTIQATATSRGS
ncbi:hypothetical protein SERLA73DRAFT_161157 [Serpula lacrymans var. lacrymans S7.3]|uniref:Uncharacterized protein n=2 Tax=Serpula lacrymans var. lacrymans TaxID=341189 RepID=F8PZL8_SERL3|nr:uncharacterized protein SERLADRAFT_416196 [Serpula lacrymans var. lacrymans S7.9]EGN98340.1 hypothetical protein SERLA73DRAFT_161157 [Serpula lacrymans var. lacrymans S7.3]EGO23904.1 hypothetical protein SERLADRAFT_416196 [Serpula lacrymans var. lacrymans S7.9]